MKHLNKQKRSSVGRKARMSTVAQPDVPDLSHLGTNDRIIEGAKIMFMRYGYSETSMHMLCKVASVSTSTLYQHFPDGKESLFRQILSRVGERLVESLSSLEGRAMSAEFALKELGQAVVTFVYSEDNLAMVRAGIGGASRFPEVSQIINESYNQVLTLGEDFFKKAGCFNDSNSVAETFLTLLTGTTYIEALISPKPVSRRRLKSMLNNAVSSTITLLSSGQLGGVIESKQL